MMTDKDTFPPLLDADDHVRENFDAMTRKYLLMVLNDDIIKEHRHKQMGHHSEPLARLLAWCHRRPIDQQYSLRLGADGGYRIIRMSGRRGIPPAYVGETVFATIDDARHGVFLKHIRDLTGG
jgi:branched-chain amino acid transport system permease protein